jgi:hypothetical protein
MRGVPLLNRALLASLAVVALAAAGTVEKARGAADPKQKESRQSLIARSKVWTPTDVPSLDLKAGPSDPGAFALGEIITCDYVDKKMSGASPKFACRAQNGDELKVKYGGGTNGEVYSEVAASRLLWALGFGADRMYSVRVVCRGCPSRIGGVLKANGDRLLDPAAVERKFPGEELSDRWTWSELDQTDESVGGATKAERDALKLLAVLLQHSDSKPIQQRIVCADGAAGEGGRCEMPLMMMQDLGIMFGRANTFNLQPKGSMDLAGWSATPVWKGASGCIGNLAGSFTGTLKEPVISEAGRKFLADLLVQVSDQQLRDMFEAARVTLRPRVAGDGRSGFPAVDEWVDAFKKKRAEIVERSCQS